MANPALFDDPEVLFDDPNVTFDGVALDTDPLVEISRPLYFGDGVYVGSRARVWLPGIDRSAGTDVAMDPEGITVRVWKPDGTELEDVTELEVGTYGGEDDVPYLDFEEDALNQVGYWTAQGFADAYRSTPVRWKVLRNPG